MNTRIFGVPDALQSLQPGALWAMVGDGWEDLQWNDSEKICPLQDAVLAEVVRLQAEYDALLYRKRRAAEYPPMADYLDAVVKGDEVQVQAYIDACLAVKAAYPKP